MSFLTIKTQVCVVSILLALSFARNTSQADTGPLAEQLSEEKENLLIECMARAIEYIGGERPTGPPSGLVLGQNLPLMKSVIVYTAVINALPPRGVVEAIGRTPWGPAANHLATKEQQEALIRALCYGGSAGLMMETLQAAGYCRADYPEGW
ncbi:MAG: hypothetical protein LBI20_04000 [Holosporales bacterium]|jgi:hypothetical protein|nr:hypothetical protein [Holosporales bacterium]